MSIFKRLFKIGQAEAHSAIDKMEDPIKLTEQGIRDMKVDLDKSLHGLAQIKALAIRARNDMESNTQRSAEYENKAILLIKNAGSGQMDQAESDRLAAEALNRKEECLKAAEVARLNKEKLEDSADQMEGNIRTLKSTISKWEDELKTLRARIKVSEATQNLNKQLAQLDVAGTVTLLERMKDKVAEQEALAESYAQIADNGRTLDQEIDKALEGAAKSEANKALEELKARLAETE